MRATVFGGAMIDTIALVDNDRIERMSMRNARNSFLLVEQGQKVEAGLISCHCGGGGVNVSVAMARMGLETTAVVKVGCDARGASVREYLEAENITAGRMLEDPRLPTGSSILISSHEKDAAIFTCRGANTLLAPEELTDDMFEADLVHVAGLSDGSSACFPEIVRRAKGAGAMVSVNPGIRQLTSRVPDFLDALSYIDILSLNRREAEALLPHLAIRSGPPPPASDALASHSLASGSVSISGHGTDMQGGGSPLLVDGLSAAGLHFSLEAYSARLEDLGLGRPGGLLLTDGSAGACFLSGRAVTHVPAKPVEMAGSAGAGDAFVATFAARTCLGDDPGTALRMAAENAASVVSFPDTCSGLLDSAELARRVAAL